MSLSAGAAAEVGWSAAACCSRSWAEASLSSCPGRIAAAFAFDEGVSQMEDFLVTKSAIIAKLIDAYPQNQKTWVLPTTKADALKALDNIKSTIELMEDFDRFPEGATGVILYALLKTGSVVCPDVGDFSHYKQGCEQILKVASSIVAEETIALIAEVVALKIRVCPYNGAPIG